MKKLLAGLAILVVLSVLGYFGLSRYQHYQFIKAISPPIKNTSLRVANVASFETEGIKVTYKEMFEKLDSDIVEIDKRILEVQTASPPSKREVKDAAVDYMRGCQHLLRSLFAKYNARLSANTAGDLAEQAAEAAKASSFGDSDYAFQAWERALKDREKAVEEFRSSVSDLVSAANTLKGTLARVAGVLPGDTLVEPSLLDAIQKKNDRKGGNKPSPTNAAPVPTGPKGGEQAPIPGP